ncbi:COP9 signalosome-like protein subunit 6 [Xylariaceae sp. FL1019]|nr:COP9 signalosome-like protein subunit 6 [Xylariaceae sp. FL1019]
MEEANANPLLSSQKSSDSGLQAVLHPLVLLTISDYITRHTLREQPGPIVGALLGQQNGREITIEHAFECAAKVVKDEVVLDADWFKSRLEQMTTMYKAPQLDLVGWYTLLPKSGPTAAILPIHKWILNTHNESSLLLGFHQDEVIQHSAGSRLPLTIYESNYEADEPRHDQGEDKEMRDGEPPLSLKFRELRYSVETGEAEMISMDFVARGAGNAAAIETRESKKAPSDDPKGKRKMDDRAEVEQSEGLILSREDEEMIAALSAKGNSVKMLEARIDLLAKYLEHLPQNNAMITDEGEQTTPSHTILRSIEALTSRFSLLVPAATEAFEQEMLSESNDVNLMELLNNVMHSVADIRNIGKKYNIVESSKTHSRKANFMDNRFTTEYRSAGDLATGAM